MRRFLVITAAVLAVIIFLFGGGYAAFMVSGGQLSPGCD